MPNSYKTLHSQAKLRKYKIKQEAKKQKFADFPRIPFENLDASFTWAASSTRSFNIPIRIGGTIYCICVCVYFWFDCLNDQDHVCVYVQSAITSYKHLNTVITTTKQTKGKQNDLETCRIHPFCVYNKKNKTK